MDAERLVYGLIGVALGFVCGFVSGLRRNRKLLRQARQNALIADQNSAHLMETIMRDSEQQS